MKQFQSTASSIPRRSKLRSIRVELGDDEFERGRRMANEEGEEHAVHRRFPGFSILNTRLHIYEVRQWVGFGPVSLMCWPIYYFKLSSLLEATRLLEKITRRPNYFGPMGRVRPAYCTLGDGPRPKFPMPKW